MQASPTNINDSTIRKESSESHMEDIKESDYPDLNNSTRMIDNNTMRKIMDKESRMFIADLMKTNSSA